jgi:hypothetical protein
MKMYQIAILGKKPQGGYFKTQHEARREIHFLKQEDRDYAERAMAEAGIKLNTTEYEIVEVEVN